MMVIGIVLYNEDVRRFFLDSVREFAFSFNMLKGVEGRSEYSLLVHLGVAMSRGYDLCAQCASRSVKHVDFALGLRMELGLFVRHNRSRQISRP